jgi:hypothetical protein
MLVMIKTKLRLVSFNHYARYLIAPSENTQTTWRARKTKKVHYITKCHIYDCNVLKKTL